MEDTSCEKLGLTHAVKIGQHSVGGVGDDDTRHDV